VQWQRMYRVHCDLDVMTARIHSMLKLWCNKCSTYTERLTPSFIDKKAQFQIHMYLSENINLGHGSRGNWSQKWLLCNGLVYHPTAIAYCMPRGDCLAGSSTLKTYSCWKDQYGLEVLQGGWFWVMTKSNLHLVLLLAFLVFRGWGFSKIILQHWDSL
jgi:hypothetical protein